MFKGFRRRHQLRTPRIGFIPLLDVVFQLLLFFLLTSNLVRPEGFNLSLPKAKTQTVKERGIRVIIPQKGNYKIDNRSFTENGLKKYLNDAAAKNPDLIVHLVADEQASSQRLVTALEIATGAGVKNALLRTERSGGVE